MKKPSMFHSRGCFTLVELLVSMAILSLLLVMMGAMVTQTSNMWSNTRGKIEQFREARDGFEAMTRQISQATLNTYWDYEDANGNVRTPSTAKAFTPARYARQSELRFVSGPSSELMTEKTDIRPTHSIFFQAPLGVVSNDESYGGLQYLLNNWGYYIEYADDHDGRPTFISAATVPYKTRFRLMELIQPSEYMTLYQYTSGTASGDDKKGRQWFTDALSGTVTSTGTNNYAHVLADNIIALVVLPRLSSSDLSHGSYTTASLAPDYIYNSTGYSPDGTKLLSTTSNKDLNPKNQLPPVVQVSMVAIDETSAARMTPAQRERLYDKVNGLFSDPNRFDADLKMDPGNAGDNSLEKYLVDNKINYRIFTTNVSVKAAKWSREQTK